MLCDDGMENFYVMIRWIFLIRVDMCDDEMENSEFVFMCEVIHVEIVNSMLCMMRWGNLSLFVCVILRFLKLFTTCFLGKTFK